MKKRVLVTALLLVLLASLFAVSSIAVQARELNYSKVVPVYSIVEGEEYMLGIQDVTILDVSGKKDFVMKGVPSSKNKNGLEYEIRPESSTIDDKYVWIFRSMGEGTYSLYSPYAEQYLKLSKNAAELSPTPYALTVVFNGAKVKISARDGNNTYSLCLASKANACAWSATTSKTNVDLTLFAANGTKTGEYNNNGQKPLFTVACFSDLHIDYGIQSWATPIRKGTIKAAEFIRDQLGPVDVMLVGGDITSNNAKKTWTSALWQKSMDTVVETLSMATKDGKILMVSGNHENEAGVSSGDTIHTGEFEPYMLAGAGEFVSAFYFDDMEGRTSKFNELLCYRYTFAGMEIIGMNTPYRSSRSSGYIYLEQVQWVESQLKEIGADKTVIIFCHYPLNSMTDPSGGTASRNKLTSVLKNYPNAIYCYGHIHGNDVQYAWYGTSELTYAINAVKPLGNGAFASDSFIISHMGSMGYYDNQFQPGGLQAAEPAIVQFNTISFYSDHITFKMYNVGEKSGDKNVYELYSFTVAREMSQLDGYVAPQQPGGNVNTNDPLFSTSSANLPLIIGVISAVVVVAVAAVLVVFYLRKNKQK